MAPVCALLSCMTRKEEALLLVCSFERYRTRQESLPCAPGKSNSLLRSLTFSHCLVSSYATLPSGVRKYPSNPQPASLPVIPQGVPVDYFDPLYFRTVLTTQERDSYRDTGVCLPAINRRHADSDNPVSFAIDTLDLDEADFMEGYGEETKRAYF